MRLILGVLDIPYSNSSESQTTGDVAQILEDKYHVMQTFFDMHDKEIVGDIESGIAGAIENAIGGKKEVNLFAGAMSKTEQRFRDFIDRQEHGIHLKKMDAPKAGARKKRQYKKVENTTAFIDSGLMRISMKAWIEE